VSPALKAREACELLVEQYRMAPAPDPSRELLARMHARAVRVISQDIPRDGVIVPFAPR
jgi:hypothetical protein